MIKTGIKNNPSVDLITNKIKIQIKIQSDQR